MYVEVDCDKLLSLVENHHQFYFLVVYCLSLPIRIKAQGEIVLFMDIFSVLRLEPAK